MEHQLEVCSAAAWLAITEQNRLSDRLAILSKEAKVEQCHQTKHCGGRGEHEKQGELYHEIWQSSNIQTNEGSSVSITKTQKVDMDRNASPCAESLKEEEELLLPMNIMTTIQKVLQDSLGLDVTFD
ncbi:hypothetical protein Q1695_013674 [Nippostrongylus brasiliensis]|nr:hypothetical protein Q1695_013674 [Nippostrongylus brasiliensis]